MGIVNRQHEELHTTNVSPRVMQLMTDLNNLYTAPAVPPIPDLPSTSTLMRTRSRLSWRVRGILIAAFTALCTGGLSSYFHMQSVTSVSAQTVLHRAVLALPHDINPDMVTHIKSESQDSNGSHLFADIWMRRSADGTLLLMSSRTWDSHGTLQGRELLNGTTRMTLDGVTHVAHIVTGIPPTAPVRSAEQNSPSWTAILTSAQQGARQDLRLLPQETVDGSSVYVLEETHAVNDLGVVGKSVRRLYIDVHSYAVRRIGSDDFDAQGNLLNSTTQNLSYENVPVASVPSSVFTMDLPQDGNTTTAVYTGPR